MSEEKVLVILKPDAIVRGIVGEVITRFEKKGLKILGTKMSKISDILLEEHYAHVADKPFFGEIRSYMQASPVILMAFSGVNAVKASRMIVGATDGSEAAAGTIRGDFALSIDYTVVHASDTPENGEVEVKRFFNEEEIFNYEKPDIKHIYKA
ncbi:MAG TPA: nucleoside-diphosphate kinase [Candidatus Pacebacteria bacterium]|nr:nucleoside-diphosphate kinase [Candidatus Paceibacterota bacterium]HIP34223.1 nucleoside-diphosphate kinase [Bacteroidia bacterium]